MAMQQPVFHMQSTMTFYYATQPASRKISSDTYGSTETTWLKEKEEKQTKNQEEIIYLHKKGLT